MSVCRLLLAAAGVKADNKRQDNVSFQTSVHYLVGAYLPHLTVGTGDLQPTRQGPCGLRGPRGRGGGAPMAQKGTQGPRGVGGGGHGSDRYP